MIEEPFGFGVERKGDRWQVCLPHQCGEWNITGEDEEERDWGEAYVSHADAIDSLEAFIAEAQDALSALREQRELKPSWEEQT